MVTPPVAFCAGRRGVSAVASVLPREKRMEHSDENTSDAQAAEHDNHPVILTRPRDVKRLNAAVLHVSVLPYKRLALRN